ncbi:kelch-like protein 5 [Arctopsyche grandis]|uniref:kelch-like protein 5 n=1 Tax=Arctopsyche grandis TaxID=121162 RepID=UPI00406D6678
MEPQQPFGAGPDVTDGSPEIPAHFIFITACGTQLFYHLRNKLELNVDEFVVECDYEFSSETVQNIFQYFYTGSINKLEVNKIGDTLKLAELMNLEQITKYCFSYMYSNLDSKNFLSFLQLAEQYSHTPLIEKSKQYVLDNFSEVMNSDAFLNLDADILVEFFVNDDLNVTSEQQVCLALKRWAMYDWNSRSAHFYDIVDHIRLPFLPVDFFADEIYPLCSGTEKCNTMLMNMLLWHHLPERRPNLMSMLTIPRKHTLTLLIVGGDKCDNAREIVVYDPVINAWSILMTLNFQIHSFSALMLEDKLMIFGGYINQNEYTNKVWSICLRTKELIEVSQMLHARSDFATVILDNDIYVIGGETDWGEDKETASEIMNNVEK